MFHSLTVLSYDADATVCPSREKTTDVTQPVWPFNSCTHWPVSVVHSLTVLSSDADATVCPSREKTTTVTRSVWPSSTWKQESHFSWAGLALVIQVGTLLLNKRRAKLFAGA